MSSRHAEFDLTKARIALSKATTDRAIAVIVALHHHVVEYPKPAKALSERIGTASY